MAASTTIAMRSKSRANDLRNALDALLADKLPSKPEQIAFGCAIARTKPLCFVRKGIDGP